jgi:DNA-binding cell septation regulator SpoVG
MQNRITEIEIVPIKPSNGLVGFASFVFDRCFYLGSIGIFTRPKGGYRLTYPKQHNKMAFNVFYPIDKAIAEVIEQAIAARFEEIMSK